MKRRIATAMAVAGLGLGCAGMTIAPGVVVDAHWNGDEQQVEAGVQVKVCELVGHVSLPSYAGVAFGWAVGALCD